MTYKLFRQHLGRSRNLILGRCDRTGSASWSRNTAKLIYKSRWLTDDEWDHGGSIASGGFKSLDELLHFPYFDILFGLVGLRCTHPDRLDLSNSLLSESWSTGVSRKKRAHEDCFFLDEEVPRDFEWVILGTRCSPVGLIMTAPRAFAFCPRSGYDSGGPQPPRMTLSKNSGCESMVLICGHGYFNSLDLRSILACRDSLRMWGCGRMSTAWIDQ